MGCGTLLIYEPNVWMPQERHEPARALACFTSWSSRAEYVFHGSPTPEIAELETRQAYPLERLGHRSGRPAAVVATPYARHRHLPVLVYLDSTSFGANDDRLVQRRRRPWSWPGAARSLS